MATDSNDPILVEVIHFLDAYFVPYWYWYILGILIVTCLLVFLIVVFFVSMWCILKCCKKKGKKRIKNVDLYEKLVDKDVLEMSDTIEKKTQPKRRKPKGYKPLNDLSSREKKAMSVRPKRIPPKIQEKESSRYSVHPNADIIPNVRRSLKAIQQKMKLTEQGKEKKEDKDEDESEGEYEDESEGEDEEENENFAVVMENYTPKKDDFSDEEDFSSYLKIKVGQRIKVLKQFPNGWCVGVNQQTKKEGFFPSNFVDFLKDSEEISFN